LLFYDEVGDVGIRGVESHITLVHLLTLDFLLCLLDPFSWRDRKVEE